MVELPIELQGKSATKDLSVDDFVVLLDGQSQPILDYAAVTANDLHPYQTLIYIDAELTHSHQLRASADVLLQAVEDLLRLGTVDVVMADPEPRFLIRDSDDSQLLGNALSADVWDDVSEDRIRALRSGFLEAIRDLESVEEVRELAAAAASEEVRLVQRRLDILLSFLAEGGTPGKLRALLLIGLRFDLDPASFYSAWTGNEGDSPGLSMTSNAALNRRLRQVAAAVAAYGWITFPVAAAEPASPLLPGVRIGKWRIAGPAGGRIIGLQIVRESERKPELAEGYLQNGEALLAQGKPAEARDAFKRALHHYHGDPRTAEAQAQALLGLAAAEEALGHDDRARTAVDLAAQVDDEFVAEQGEVVALLQDPLAPLTVLAAESSGRILHERETVKTLLAELLHRQRLSLQLVGEPSGKNFSVALSATRPGLTVSGPAWVRFGTVEEVASARTRLAMEGESVDPTHHLDARFEHQPGRQDSALLELRLEIDADALSTMVSGDARCRLTIGTGSFEEGTQAIEHKLVSCDPSDSGLMASDRLSTESDFVVVLLEHLPSAAWGMTVVEREDPY